MYLRILSLAREIHLFTVALQTVLFYATETQTELMSSTGVRLCRLDTSVSMHLCHLQLRWLQSLRQSINVKAAVHWPVFPCVGCRLQ